MALSKECPSCHEETSKVYQCRDCNHMYCDKCNELGWGVTIIGLPCRGFQECPKCESRRYDIVSVDDDYHEDLTNEYLSSNEESDSSDQEENYSESSYSSSGDSGSSDSSGSGAGILSIVAVIAIFLFFKYGSVGTQQQTNPVVVSPSPTPIISVNESAEHIQPPATLSVSPQEVTALKFYESRYSVPLSMDQRMYSNTFYQGSVHYIYWELTLQTSRQESNSPLNITAVWSGPNGSPEFARQDNAFTAPANSNSWLASSGWGNPNGNGFQPGVYEIKFYSDGRQITNARFEILPSSGESGPQALESAAPEPPPTQPADQAQPIVIAQPQPYVQRPTGVIVVRPRHYVQIMPHPRNYAPPRQRLR